MTDASNYSLDKYFSRYTNLAAFVFRYRCTRSCSILATSKIGQCMIDVYVFTINM